MRDASAFSVGALMAELGAMGVKNTGKNQGWAPPGKVTGKQAAGPAKAAPSKPSSPAPTKPPLSLDHQRFCAQGLLMPDEDPAQLRQFVADFCCEVGAVGVVQTVFATRAAELTWKLRRLPVLEGAVLAAAREASGEEEAGIGALGDLVHQFIGLDEDDLMARLQRYETRLERSISRCLREVKLLQGMKKRAAGAEGSGSFRQSAVGSFRQPVQEACSQEASVCEAASPARGPSAARQDDELLHRFAKAGSGSFGTNACSDDAVGSFEKGSAVRLAASGPLSPVRAGEG